MSARKTFPNQAYNSTQKRKVLVTCSEQTHDRPDNRGKDGGGPHVVDSDTSDSSKEDGETEALPCPIIKIKQEVTDEVAGSSKQQPQMLLMKKFEIKLEKMPMNTVKGSGKSRRQVETDASGSCLLPNGNMQVNDTLSPPNHSSVLTRSHHSPKLPLWSKNPRETIKIQLPGAASVSTSASSGENTHQISHFSDKQDALLTSPKTFLRGNQSTETPIFTPTSPVDSFNNIASKVPEDSSTFSSKKLTANDLRHRIASCKKTQDSTHSNETAEEDILLNEFSEEENLDSMSIHADDDDLLDDERSPSDILNSYGKQFSALEDKRKSRKINNATSSNASSSKRKCSELNEDQSYGKSRRMDSEKEKGREKIPTPPPVCASSVTPANTATDATTGSGSHARLERPNRWDVKEKMDVNARRERREHLERTEKNPRRENSDLPLGAGPAEGYKSFSRIPETQHHANSRPGFSESMSNDQNNKNHSIWNGRNFNNYHGNINSNHNNQHFTYRSTSGRNPGMFNGKSPPNHPLPQNIYPPNRGQLRHNRPPGIIPRPPVGSYPPQGGHHFQPRGHRMLRPLPMPIRDHQDRWAPPPEVDRYRPNGIYSRQRSYDYGSSHDKASYDKPTMRQPLMSTGSQHDNAAKSSVPIWSEKESAKGQKISELYSSLKSYIRDSDFDRYMPTCDEILKLADTIDKTYLDEMLRTLAGEAEKQTDKKLISYVFNEIRKACEITGFSQHTYNTAIEAYLSSEEVDEAIKLFLEMKNRGFKPTKNVLVLIKNGFFEHSVQDVDSFIKFLESLDEGHVTKRLVEETLNLMSPEELRTKTKNQRILSFVKNKKPDAPLPPIPTAQPSVVVIRSPFDRELDKINQTLSSSDNILDAQSLVYLIKTINTPDDARSVVMLFREKISKDILAKVDKVVWNEFLTLACVGPYANVQVASQIEGIMKENQIHLNNQAAFQLVLCLLRAGFNQPAVQNLKEMNLDELNKTDLNDELNDSLCKILQQPDSYGVDVNVTERFIRILIKCKRQPPEDKLLQLLSCFKNASNYQKIQEIIAELHKCNMRPSFKVYRLAFAALELWVENPNAVIELFGIMKRSYPQRRLLSVENDLDGINGSFSSNTSSLSDTVNDNAQQDTASVISSNDDDHDDNDDEVEKVASLPYCHEGGNSAALPKNKGVCEFFLDGKLCPKGQACSESHCLSAPLLLNPFQASLGEEPRLCDSGYGSNDSINPFFPPARPPSVEPLPDNAEYQKYYKRMMFAAGLKEHKDLYKTFISMRKKNVVIDDQILRFIYASLVEFPSERFEQLSDLVKNELPGQLAIKDDDENDDTLNSLQLLSDDDQEILGRLGVGLMIHCNGEGLFTESHRILHQLHNLQINYAMFGLSFQQHIPDMTHCEVTVMAIDLCLKQKPAEVEDAYVVLTSTNYGLPVDKDVKLGHGEIQNRRLALIELLELMFNDDEHYERVVEILKRFISEDSLFSYATERLNSLLSKSSETNQVERARDVFQFMETERCVISYEAYRAYLNCLANAERIIAARHVYNSARLLKIYSVLSDVKDPYRLTIEQDLTKTEMLFVLEDHLTLIRDVLRRTPPDAILPAPCDLTVVFYCNEVTSSIANMVLVATKIMNPPLVVANHPGQEDSELHLGHSSIVNWYNNIPVIAEHRVNLDASLPVAVEENQDYRKTVYREGAEASLFSSEEPKNTSSGRGRMQDVLDLVNSRVMFYLKEGRVQKGKAFHQCCQTLIKLYMKHSKQEQVPMDGRAAHVNTFVDNFFKDHETFLPLQGAVVSHQRISA
eukprot:gene5169-5821_t